MCYLFQCGKNCKEASESEYFLYPGCESGTLCCGAGAGKECDFKYKDCQAEKKQKASGAVKFVLATALTILGALGIKKLFFKKS